MTALSLVSEFRQFCYHLDAVGAAATAAFLWGARMRSVGVRVYRPAPLFRVFSDPWPGRLERAKGETTSTAPQNLASEPGIEPKT